LKKYKYEFEMVCGESEWRLVVIKAIEDIKRYY